MPKQEREWRGHRVDINLRDEWLEKLNAMGVLELRSVCEGHTRDEDPLSRNAHITAVIRDCQQVFFHRNWEELRDVIAGLLGECFCRNDARVKLEAKRRMSLTPSSEYIDFHQTIFVSATKRHARERKRIDEETLAWLENAVGAFMQLDVGLLALSRP